MEFWGHLNICWNNCWGTIYCFFIYITTNDDSPMVNCVSATVSHKNDLVLLLQHRALSCDTSSVTFVDSWKKQRRKNRCPHFKRLSKYRNFTNLFWWHSKSYLVNSYLSYAYYVPSTVLGTENTMENNTIEHLPIKEGRRLELLKGIIYWKNPPEVICAEDVC